MKYTIIVTVYNKEKYIERCLKSACNQTYKDYQVIVINDGSIDNSEKIIKKYQKKYKFKYYYKKNTGIADTRNFAIEKVKTDYFLFLDADDYISLDLLNTIDKYDKYDVLSFNAIKLDENQVFLKKMNKPIFKGSGKDFFIKLIKDKCEFTVPWGYIYNTEYFKSHEFTYPKGNILEDYFLTPFIIVECKKIISIDYNGYYYVSTKNSIMNDTRNIKLITDTYLGHFDKALNIINNSKYDDNLSKVYKTFLAHILIWYGSNLSKKDQYEYINELEKRKIYNYIDNKIIILMYKLKIYYPIRKLIKGGA